LHFARIARGDAVVERGLTRVPCPRS
jgi:hypothetical protein